MPDGGFKYIAGKQRQDKEVWVGNNLIAGTYFLYLKVNWKKPKYSFVLSNYGPKKLEFEVIHKNLVPQMIDSSLKNKAST